MKDEVQIMQGMSHWTSMYRLLVICFTGLDMDVEERERGMHCTDRSKILSLFQFRPEGTMYIPKTIWAVIKEAALQAQ